MCLVRNRRAPFPLPSRFIARLRVPAPICPQRRVTRQDSDMHLLGLEKAVDLDRKLGTVARDLGVYCHQGDRGQGFRGRCQSERRLCGVGSSKCNEWHILTCTCGPCSGIAGSRILGTRERGRRFGTCTAGFHSVCRGSASRGMSDQKPWVTDCRGLFKGREIPAISIPVLDSIDLV